MAGKTDTFYFDAGCGFCQWCAALLGLLVSAKLAVVPARPRDAGLPVEVASEIDVHAVVCVGDEYFYGHQAIGYGLRVHGRAGVIRLVGNLLCLRVMAPLWEWMYRLVATNRHQLSRWVGAEVCQVG